MDKLWEKLKTLPVVYLPLVLIIALGVFFLIGRDRDLPVVLEEQPSEQVSENLLEDEVAENEDEELETEIPEEIFVHVSGQVNRPGVVCLPSGARVYEAVEMAGGMNADGDLESVNLAAVLLDQQKVVVGSLKQRLAQGETVPIGEIMPEEPIMPADDGKININTATKDQLESLPGIGPVIADHIVTYRQANGGFKNIEEIKNVHRIGEATFANIKELIGVR